MDSIRGIFALMIVWHHLAEMFGIPYEFDFGNSIVLFFFVVSGFHISLGWGDKIEGREREFILKRCVKIFPLQWLTLGLFSPLWNQPGLLVGGAFPRDLDPVLDSLLEGQLHAQPTLVVLVKPVLLLLGDSARPQIRQEASGCLLDSLRLGGRLLAPDAHCSSRQHRTPMAVLHQSYRKVDGLLPWNIDGPGPGEIASMEVDEGGGQPAGFYFVGNRCRVGFRRDYGSQAYHPAEQLHGSEVSCSGSVHLDVHSLERMVVGLVEKPSPRRAWRHIVGDLYDPRVHSLVLGEN